MSYYLRHLSHAFDFYFIKYKLGFVKKKFQGIVIISSRLEGCINRTKASLLINGLSWESAVETHFLRDPFKIIFSSSNKNIRIIIFH